MLDFILLFNAMVEALRNMRRPLARCLAQPVLTAALLTCLYAGYHVVHESSLLGGLRAAFLETGDDRAARQRETEDATLQAELRHMAAANNVIDQLLGGLTRTEPAVARARLHVIHNGVRGVTGLGLLRYDVTNSVAGPGHAGGPLIENQPLSDWRLFLPALLGGDCTLVAVEAMNRTPFRTRLDDLNVGTVLMCPVADALGRVLGATSIQWDAGTRVPDGEDLGRLKQSAIQAGTRIAAVLAVR